MIPVRLFSESICRKFPLADHRATPNNADRMLRGNPTSPLSNLQRRELEAVVALSHSVIKARKGR